MLLHESFQDFQVDIVFGVADMMARARDLKAQDRRGDETWLGIRDAVRAALEGS